MYNENIIDQCIIQNPPRQIYSGLANLFEDIQEIHHDSDLTQDFIEPLYTRLKDNILGQETAIDDLIAALYLFVKKDDSKPLVLLFFGPEGVGKTETAKILNSILDKNKLFRKQFSMFQTMDFSTYIFGDFDNQSSFAKDLLINQSKVLLFDEFDKCQSYFHNAFYQLFDEGVYTDKNYEVELNNNIIICTSNYNSHEEIINFLGGPIYSRFDAIIQFNPLSNEVKKELINRSYKKNINIFDISEQEIIENNNILHQLLSFSDNFRNARDIDKFTKLIMAHQCTKKFHDKDMKKANSSEML